MAPVTDGPFGCRWLCCVQHTFTLEIALGPFFLSEAVCSYGLCRTFNMLPFGCAPVKCFSDDSPRKNQVAATWRVSASLPGESCSSVLNIAHFGFGMHAHTHGVVNPSQAMARRKGDYSEAVSLLLDDNGILR